MTKIAAAWQAMKLMPTCGKHMLIVAVALLACVPHAAAGSREQELKSMLDRLESKYAQNNGLGKLDLACAPTCLVLMKLMPIHIRLSPCA